MLEVNFSPFPELITDRLILKSLTLADAEKILQLRSDPEVMKFINRPLTANITEAEDWVRLVLSNQQANNGITWGIFLKGQPLENIGNIGLWRIEKENYRAEVGYMMDPMHQGKGMMLEALKRVILYGFNDLGVHSIEAQIHPENIRSSKLLEKTGFTKEAYFKQNIFWNGGFEDTAVYSLLRQATALK